MKADKFLEEKGLEFELVEQENPTKSCDDAARERGVDTSQIVKSLIVKQHEEKGVKDGELIHVLLPGDREISEKKFGEYHLVEPEKSRELTGFESGTVHPFSTEIQHIIDYRVLENNELSFTVGDKLTGLIIQEKEFKKALEKADFSYEVQDISLTTDQDISDLEEKGLSEEDARFITDRGLTPVFTELDYQNEKVVKALQEFLRHDLEVERDTVSKIIEESENLNHLQKLVENFAETGEIKEAESFDTEKVVERVLDDHPEALEDLEDGKDSVHNFIIGQVMQRTSGKARPDRIEEVLEDEY